jgi:RNA polymerase sigma-70 factor (ECF subfamily)
VTANELAQIVHEALDGLSANHRQVIELRYVGELSYRETALVLGITPNNAGVRITRALAHLKEALSQRFDAKDYFSIDSPAVPARL